MTPSCIGIPRRTVSDLGLVWQPEELSSTLEGVLKWSSSKTGFIEIGAPGNCNCVSFR